MSVFAEHTLELHKDAIVIDLHADTFEMVRPLGYDLSKEHRSSILAARLLGHVDIPRMKRAGLTAQFFGIVIPPWSTRKSAPRKIERQGRLVTSTCERFPDNLLRARTANDVRRAHEKGVVAAFLGVEASHGISENTAALDVLVSQQIRYLGPAHLFDSAAGLSHYWHRSTEAGPSLPECGQQLVDELRKRSILIDLAHMAKTPFLEICATAHEPVIVSHTGLSGVYKHWRNIDDQQVRAVAATGGVIGVIMTQRYLGRQGAAGVVDHLLHLISVGGEDIAALGSDFDGLIRPPRDMVDVTGLPLITEELLNRGVSETLIRKILGENVLRLLQEVPPSRKPKDERQRPQ